MFACHRDLIAGRMRDHNRYPRGEGRRKRRWQVRWKVHNSEADRWELLRRLNNSFIEVLFVCFACSHSLAFLCDNSDSLRCRVGEIYPCCGDAAAFAIDYELVRFAMRKFQPLIYRPNKCHGCLKEYLLLFDYTSMRDEISHLGVDVSQ